MWPFYGGFNFNRFPYTKYNEINLDWFLSAFHQSVEANQPEKLKFTPNTAAILAKNTVRALVINKSEIKTEGLVKTPVAVVISGNVKLVSALSQANQYHNIGTINGFKDLGMIPVNGTTEDYVYFDVIGDGTGGVGKAYARGYIDADGTMYICGGTGLTANSLNSFSFTVIK